MTDPIKAVLDWYFCLFSGTGSMVFFQVMVLCMLVCIFCPNLMNAKQRQREHQVTHISLDLIQRIESLWPIFEDETMLYLESLRKKIGQNPGIIAIANKIPREVKTKAERDFCIHDAEKLEAVTMLQAQTIHMVEKLSRS